MHLDASGDIAHSFNTRVPRSISWTREDEGTFQTWFEFNHDEVLGQHRVGERGKDRDTEIRLDHTYQCRALMHPLRRLVGHACQLV